jgi:glycosyltransferase involved in cell wall biosynthesis
MNVQDQDGQSPAQEHRVAPLRVLHAVEGLRTGGIGMLLYNYFMGMDHSKIAFDFMVHFPEPGLAEHLLEKEGCQMFHLPPVRHLFRVFFQTRKVIKQGHYRIVHVHHTCHSFVQLLAAWSCGVKVRIAHSHDALVPRGVHRFTYALYAWLTARFATHWFACSDLAGRYVFREGIRSSRFRVLRNAIDVRRYRFDHAAREAIRAKYHLQDCFVLIHVGRMTNQKNHERLVGIFNEVQKSKPSARLLLIGSGVLEADIHAQVHELGLEDKILFLGETSDVPAFLQAADVFVFPSRHEGLGMVLVEAQAAGLPCVASASRVPKEADLTGLVQFLSLEEPDSIWARAICSACNPDRSSGLEKVRRAGYDITTEARNLEKWYSQQQV